MKSISRCLLMSLTLATAGIPEHLKGVDPVSVQEHNERVREAANLFIRLIQGVRMNWEKTIAHIIHLISGNPYFVHTCKYLYAMKDQTQAAKIGEIFQKMLADPQVKEEMERSADMKRILKTLEEEKNKYTLGIRWQAHLLSLVQQSLKCK